MALRGGMQMSGYIGRPEETAKSLRDGWLITGDMAYIEDGYVYMLGRADDIINTGDFETLTNFWNDQKC